MLINSRIRLHYRSWCQDSSPAATAAASVFCYATSGSYTIEMGIKQGDPALGTIAGGIYSASTGATTINTCLQIDIH
jgi:hypothetical protein